MVLSRGSVVNIEGVGKGALSEDVTVGLSTSFKPMFTALSNDTVAKAMEAVTVAGTLGRALGFGFGGQFKQATAQMWDKTEPASLRIGVDFHNTV